MMIQPAIFLAIVAATWSLFPAPWWVYLIGTWAYLMIICVAKAVRYRREVDEKRP